MRTEPLERLESRRLFAAALPTTAAAPVFPYADLLADANRDGAITAADDANENTWTPGKSGRGALVLPNFDKDNAVASGAPDNWVGGLWNGKPAAPNNVIDNAADLADVAKLRLRKLGDADAAYNYRVTLQVLRPATDPAWFKDAAATDRVRVFFPTKASGADVVAQAGDVAVIGPGIGDTIRFVNNPAAANEYDVNALAGDGWFQFGVEGIKAGAQVRFRLTVEYDPIIAWTRSPDGAGSAGASSKAAAVLPTQPSDTTDEVAVRVAPFVLNDNRQRATKVTVENLNRYGFDNADARAALRQAFGTKLVESRTGDIWQQDGYEIGYVAAPYGQMPVVLELPRARDFFFDGAANMRSFVRGTLLSSGVGVSTDLAAQPNDTASAFGGDIESLPRAGGKPGFLLSSGMPTPMKDFFAAQGTNPLLDLKLDDWLGVAHVDEVVQAAPGGKVLVADPEVAWALTLWAARLDPTARMHPGMNGNDQVPGGTAAGVTVASVLANATFRQQNVEFAAAANRLGGVRSAIKSALGLTEEVTVPAAVAGNTGSAKLARGGAFTSMLGNTKRAYEVKFLDADRYQLRYRDATGGGGAFGAYSKWFDGRRSRDEVFPEAKAYLLKNYWAGAAKAGDRFTFATNPAATLVRMPVLLATFDVFSDGGGVIGGAFDGAGTAAGGAATTGGAAGIGLSPSGWRLGAYSTNHINSVVDGPTVISGKAYGPTVNWSGKGASDLYQAYADAAFRKVGYTQVLYADSRFYHDSAGNLHCGTNVVRALPAGKWWEVA